MARAPPHDPDDVRDWCWEAEDIREIPAVTTPLNEYRNGCCDYCGSGKRPQRHPIVYGDWHPDYGDVLTRCFNCLSEPNKRRIWHRRKLNGYPYTRSQTKYAPKHTPK